MIESENRDVNLMERLSYFFNRFNEVIVLLWFYYENHLSENEMVYLIMLNRFLSTFY